MDSIEDQQPELTADRLASMKLEARDFFSEPTSPTTVNKSMSFNGGAVGSSQLVSSGASASVSRRFSRSSRRSSSFLSSHRSKMSSELTSSAESKFFALMELMANASREASSLKDVWARLIAERESWAEEREELMEQVTEVSQELDRKNIEYNRHGTGHEERKKQIEKLLVDLSVAITGVTAEKKKVAERDHQLGVARRELLESRETVTRTHNDLERVRTEHETIVLALRTAEGDRDSARDEADSLRREVHKTTRERTEISSRLTDITTKFEISHREALSLTDRLKMYDLEREEHLHEVDRLKEELRKTKTRADDTVKELLEATERSERLNREVSKLKEIIRTVELERDESVHTIEHLRRENKTVLASLTETEDRSSEITLKYEHIKRELLTTKDKLREIELERNETLESIERSREQYRVIVIERDELKNAFDISERKVHDSSRRIIALEDSLRRNESMLSESRSELNSHIERVKHITLERDDARLQHGHLHTEITELKAKIVMFQAEIRSITGHRDRLRGELEKSRAEFEEITETITSYEDGSSELEFEIESLRTLLKEAREQKERAIAARNSADHERDEHIAKYEEKCRELERYEESAASHYHAHASSRGEGRTTSSRIVSSRSNATTIHNGTN